MVAATRPRSIPFCANTWKREKNRQANEKPRETASTPSLRCRIFESVDLTRAFDSCRRFCPPRGAGVLRGPGRGQCHPRGYYGWTLRAPPHAGAAGRQVAAQGDRVAARLPPDDRESGRVHSRVCGRRGKLDVGASGSVSSLEPHAASDQESRLPGGRGNQSRDAGEYAGRSLGYCRLCAGDVGESGLWGAEVYSVYAAQNAPFGGDSQPTWTELSH